MRRHVEVCFSPSLKKKVKTTNFPTTSSQYLHIRETYPAREPKIHEILSHRRTSPNNCTSRVHHKKMLISTPFPNNSRIECRIPSSVPETKGSPTCGHQSVHSRRRDSASRSRTSSWANLVESSSKPKSVGLRVCFALFLSRSSFILSRSRFFHPVSRRRHGEALHPANDRITIFVNPLENVDQ